MQRDYHDVMWGAILALLGLGVAGYAAQHYDAGTLRRMGPGFFPIVLGLVLAVLGAVIAVPAWRRAGEHRPFAWREGVGVLGALLLFGLLMNRAGIVVSAAGATLLASAVAPRSGLVWRLVLTVVATILTWVVFILALDMPIPVWPWSR